MIIAVVVITLLGAASLVYPQEPDSGPLESLSETTGTDVWERLEDLRTDPIHLNSAGEKDLLELPWLDPATAGRIIEERKKRGGFKKLEELLDVPGVNGQVFREISPFLTVGGEMKMMARIGTRRRAGSGDVKLRVSASRRGFRSGLKVVRYGEEKGNAVGGYLRLEMPFVRGVSVTAGNFYLLLGQGLVSWSAFGGLRSPERPVVYPLSRSGARGTTGTTGRKMIKGFAADLARGNVVAGFTRGTLAGGGGQSVESLTLAVSGRKGISIEGSVLTLEESGTFAEGMVKLERGPGTWFAGSAWCSGGGSGLIAGVERGGNTTSMLILYRRFSADYDAPLAFDMAEGTLGAGNLEAVYTGIVIGRGSFLELSLYRDVGRRLFMGDEENRIRFEEFSLQARVKPARKTVFAVSLKVEEEEGAPDGGSGAGSGETGRDVEKWGRLRMDCSVRPHPGLVVRSRAEVSTGDAGANTFLATLFYLELKAGLPHEFDVRGRYTVYNCTEGGYLYVVEGGLPERSLILRLSGEGERYQLAVANRVSDGWTARSKLSYGVKRDSTYHAGFDRECWLTDLTWEFQLEHRF